MRILLMHPGHSHSTADVATGYFFALKSLGHDVHQYNYNSALAFYHMALDYWEEKNDQFKRTRNDHLLLASERAVIEAVDFVPDVVLVICGLALHRRAYELLNKLCLPIAVILTESPYADKTQSDMLNVTKASMAFTNERNSVIGLNAICPDTQVMYLPHSYSTMVHRIQPVKEMYKSDVFFFGTYWPERKELFECLEILKGSVDVQVRGLEPVKGQLLDFIDNRVLALYYNATKIALNHHRTVMGVLPDGEPEHVSPDMVSSLAPRAYEIAACGAFQLCDDSRSELGDVFGDSVPTYSNADDLVEKLLWYLEHEKQRTELARASHELVQRCSFVARTEEILIPALEKI